MCFPAGCFLAKYKVRIIPFIKKTGGKIVLIILGCGAFIYTRLDFYYSLVPQLIAYICIASCVIIIWDCAIGKNKVFERIGKASLAMYLVHIGIVDSVFSLNISINIKVTIFLAFTIVGTIMCYLFSERINNKIVVYIKNKEEV